MYTKNFKFPFFPAPAIGETVYSVVCRVQARSGLNENTILNALTGQKNKPPILLSVPSYCQTISRRVPTGHPWQNSQSIISNHSSFPFFTYFDTQDIRQKWLNKFATTSKARPLGLALGHTAYRGHASPVHPRYCEYCANEQAETLGFSYFRREHQLPWVSVCWKHGTALSIGCSICGPYPLKHAGLRMPGQCLCKDGATFLACDNHLDEMTDALKWIATQSAYMVNSPGTSSTDIRSDLKKCLIEKGLCRGSLLVHKAICSAIESRFGAPLLKKLGYPVWTNNRPSSWIVRGLANQKESKRPPVLTYLLFISAAFDSVADFESHIKRSSPGEIQGQQKSQNEFSIPTRIVDEIAGLAKTSRYGVRTIALKVGLKDSQVASVLRKKKIRLPLSKITKNKLSPKTISRIRSALKNGLAKSYILMEYNISEWTLINIELDNPGLYESQKKAAATNLIEKHRNIVRRLIQEDPNVSRETIHIDHVGTYEHLKKYDREWFDAKIAVQPRKDPSQPRAKRRNWQQIDEQKASEIKRLVAQYTDKDQKPIRITKTRLLRKLGIITAYYQNKNHFPKVQRLIQQSIESYDGFIERKIRWAIGTYEPHEAIAVNTLYRRAAVRHYVLYRFKDVVVDEAQKRGLVIHGRSCFAMSKDQLE